MKKILLAVSLIMIFSAGAYAFGGKHGGDHDGLRFMMSHHLDLSDEQEAQIEALVAGKKDDMRSKGKRMFKDMMELDPEDPNYTSQVELLAEEKSSLIKQEIIEHGELRAQIHAILTPEQRDKAKELMDKMMKRHEKRRS